ncbi:MAG: MarR family transcriptional regulator [Nannocystaceae bacterium]
MPRRAPTPASAVDEARLRALVERFGLLFESTGAARIAGRVLGWLLLCDPPEQSQPELVDALGASKASISTSLRYLTETGLVERLSLPGERRDFYRVDTEAWPRLLERRVRMIAAVREAADDGVDALGPRSRRSERLRALSSVYATLEAAMHEAVAHAREGLADAPPPRTRQHRRKRT